MLNVDSYLSRIDYNGSREPNAETLRALHKTHMLAVPFENLDNHLGRRIVLDEEKVVHKIVDQRRGGICYELNGAFCGLLRAMGFSVSMLSAGVARDEGGFDPPYDHMALLVLLEDRWLADVGFGDSFREPLLLDDRTEQLQGAEAYRLVDADGYVIVERRKGDEWKPEYRFTLEPHEYPDFRGHVPLSSDITGVDLHQTARVHASYRRRANHRQRNATDHHCAWRETRTRARQSRRMAISPARVFWSRVGKLAVSHLYETV